MEGLGDMVNLRAIIIFFLLFLLLPFPVQAHSVDTLAQDIETYSVPLGQVMAFREGDTIYPGYCGKNAILRYYQFGDKNSDGLSYFADDWHSFNETSLGYPVYLATSMGSWNETRNNWDWVHFMTAIKTGEDVSDLDSWMVFQYHDVNIKPGDWQMPVPGELWITDPVLNGFKVVDYKLIASFDLKGEASFSSWLDWWLK
jgi:hypothetical protein